MESSQLEKCSSSSNIYDDLPRDKSSTNVQIPFRNLSTISYINPHRIEIPLIKRSAVSLTLPSSSSSTTTILSINNDEQLKKELRKNEEKVEQNKESYCWIIYEMIRLIFIALFASLIGMFIFTLIVYVSDSYWINEQPLINNSRWWLENINDSNFTEMIK